MRKADQSKQSGFTLVELLVGMSLTVMLMTGLFSLLAASLGSWQQGRSRSEVQQHARFAVDSMVRDIHFANTINLNSNIQLTIATSKYVSSGEDIIIYALNTVDNQLTRKVNNGSPQPVTGDTANAVTVAQLDFRELARNASNSICTVNIFITVADQAIQSANTYTLETAATSLILKP